MKKNQILPFALTFGLLLLLVVLMYAFFKIVLTNPDTSKINKTPIEKLSSERPALNGDMSKPPQRIESRLSGTILSVKAKTKDEVEFTLFDESLKKEFSFRVSARAQVGTKSIDTEKNVITLTIGSDSGGLSSIQQGAYATVTTIDPLEARGPLQALRVTVNKPPSKK